MGRQVRLCGTGADAVGRHVGPTPQTVGSAPVARP